MTLADDWTDPIIRVFHLHVQHVDDLRADTPLRSSDDCQGQVGVGSACVGSRNASAGVMIVTAYYAHISGISLLRLQAGANLMVRPVTNP